MKKFIKKLPVTSYQLPVTNCRGVAALLTIIIISAAVLIMATSASLLGIGELELGYTSQKGGETLVATDGCLADTLRRIRLDTSYGVAASPFNLTLSNGSCIINVAQSGVNRTITVTGTVGNYSKKIEANITLSGNVITMNSWIEVSD